MFCRQDVLGQGSMSVDCKSAASRGLAQHLTIDVHGLFEKQIKRLLSGMLVYLFGFCPGLLPLSPKCIYCSSGVAEQPRIGGQQPAFCGEA